MTSCPSNSCGYLPNMSRPAKVGRRTPSTGRTTCKRVSASSQGALHGGRPGARPLQFRQVLVQLRRVQVIEGGVADRFLVKRRLAAGADVAEDLVIGHLPVGVADSDVRPFLKAGGFVVARPLRGRHFAD